MISWAWAHPMGPGGWSAYTAVKVEAESPEVVVVLEVPMQDALGRFRTYAGGRTDAEVETGFRARMWSELSQGLSVRLNGEEVRGTWEPVWTPVNGHLAEGFFVYLLRFKAQRGWSLPDHWQLEVDNQAFLESPTWWSAWVEADSPWVVTSHSAADVLQRLDPEPATAEDVWSRDSRLRTLRIDVDRRLDQIDKGLEDTEE
jgi:hypothetical protein